MKSQNFSVNAAANLLEKDRATLVRALRHANPDSHERGGQPRYSMRTIVDALARHERRGVKPPSNFQWQ